MAYRIRQGRHFNIPKPGLNYIETFLYLLDHLGEENYRPHPVITKALDVLFILHCDHELNAGTATVLQVGSTLVDPYSAVSAATAALYGPLHGGANEAVVRMLADIGGPENVPAYVEKVKKKEKVLSGERQRHRGCAGCGFSDETRSPQASGTVSTARAIRGASSSARRPKRYGSPKCGGGSSTPIVEHRCHSPLRSLLSQGRTRSWQQHSNFTMSRCRTSTSRAGVWRPTWTFGVGSYIRA